MSTFEIILTLLISFCGAGCIVCIAKFVRNSFSGQEQEKILNNFVVFTASLILVYALCLPFAHAEEIFSNGGFWMCVLSVSWGLNRLIAASCRIFFASGKQLGLLFMQIMVLNEFCVLFSINWKITFFIIAIWTVAVLALYWLYHRLPRQIRFKIQLRRKNKIY